MLPPRRRLLTRLPLRPGTPQRSPPRPPRPRLWTLPPKSAEAAGKSADASKDAADKAVEAAKEAAKPAEAPKK
jgi:hypothetical protein